MMGCQKRGVMDGQKEGECRSAIRGINCKHGVFYFKNVGRAFRGRIPNSKWKT